MPNEICRASIIITILIASALLPPPLAPPIPRRPQHPAPEQVRHLSTAGAGSQGRGAGRGWRVEAQELGDKEIIQ